MWLDFPADGEIGGETDRETGSITFDGYKRLSSMKSQSPVSAA